MGGGGGGGGGGYRFKFSGEELHEWYGVYFIYVLLLLSFKLIYKHILQGHTLIKIGGGGRALHF